MCGICGELHLDGGATAERVVAMRDALIHRGPDSDGVYVSPDRRAGLGFRRLAIIDLRPEARQPMTNEDRTVWVVFNGEVYNFQPLREELRAKGHVFKSRSDSEVIVHLYEEEGAAGLARLDGMFAIGIWDERTKRLTLARDRAGKKPLFYMTSGNTIAFASEIKAFFARPVEAPEIDPASVPSYFIHGYVPSPRTLYRHVRQVRPASTLTIDADGRTTEQVFWRLNMHQAPGPAPTEQQAAARVRELMTEAVERRLMSDVPLGAFLSGGVDSTIVVGLMSHLLGKGVRTFSIGFDGDPHYDETAYAREVAARYGTDHTEFKVTPSALDLVDTLIWHHDGPFGDSSAIPTYIVSRLTREHVTVVLTGDGGDELFAGYPRFAAGVIAERLPRGIRFPLRSVLHALPTPASDKHRLNRWRRFVDAMNLPLEERMTRWNSLFFDDLRELLSPDFVAAQPFDPLGYIAEERQHMRGLTTLGTLLHVNYRSYLLDDLLVKADRCTMANSLEARSPFLDTALVDYVGGLPDTMKLSGLKSKVILRKAFSDMLPESVATRRKMGFGVPLATWFRGELKDYVRDTLLDSSARYTTYVSARYVQRLVSRHLAGQANSGHQIWTILCFELWLRALPRWTEKARTPEAMGA